MSEILEKIENGEKEKNIQTQEKEVLDNFHREIRELKEKEEKGELKTVHLKDINPDELVFEDMAKWEQVKNNLIILDDLEDFAAELRQEGKKPEDKEEIPESRLLFAAFLLNKGAGFRQMKAQEQKKIYKMKEAA
ncbi:MAG: hypothetical protein HYW34_00255 [Candidatus Brennerbacteria bacterium]|nr:hypothetical protein [Candidatus Brennerbacteria bacterium]